MSRLDEDITDLTRWVRAIADEVQRSKSIGSQSRIYMTAPPTTGTWEQGSIIWNELPSAGAYVGWVCITSGDPGVWKGWGLIAT